MRRLGIATLIVIINEHNIAKPVKGFTLSQVNSFRSPTHSINVLLSGRGDLITNDFSPKNINDSGASTEASRRTFLFTSSAIATAAISVSSLRQMPSAVLTNTPSGITSSPSSLYKIKNLASVDEALQVINVSCNRRFLHAVIASDYNFIYRGIDSDQQPTRPSIRDEPCDLLSPSTYDSPAAAGYFQKLDEAMAGDPVRPGNGHLGITSPDAASEWGEAASVWPLGENIHFAWLRDGGVFWPRAEGLSKDVVDRSEIVVDGVNCGEVNLEDALRGDKWEVLFSAESFLAVPKTLENEFYEKLKASFIV